jgi:hypothetical protein
MGLGIYPPIAGLPWHWLPGHTALAIDVLAAVPFAFLIRQWSTTITAEGITIQTLRRRVIPWSRVRDIRADFLAGDHSIDVYLHVGTRQRLPAPVERYNAHSDETFVDKYAQILDLWKAHGRPPLSPEAIGRQPQGSGPGT